MSDWRERLKAVIEDRGITLPELAKRAEYDYVTLWKVVTTDKHTIRANNMRRLCNVLRVSPEYIWHGTGEPEPNSLVPLLESDQLLPWIDMELGSAGLNLVGVCRRVMDSMDFAWRNQSVEIREEIPVGALLYCSPNREPKNDQFVLAIYKECFVVRRYARVAGDIYLQAVDRDYRTLTLGGNDRILAVVTGVYWPLISESDDIPPPDSEK